MYKAVAAGFAALLGLSLSAQAADLNSRSFKDAPVAYGPGYSWTGLYIGGSAGFGTGDVTHTFTFTREDYEEESSESQTFKFEDTLNGAIYGAHIGYNWQFGHLVAGLEAGINGTDIDSSTSIGDGFATAETELNWYATAVARLGYAEGSWLFYGFGGLAWGNVDTSVKTAFGDDFGSGSTDHMGWTAGLGVEYAFNDRFSVRVEYSHVDLGEETVASFGEIGEGGSLSVNNKVDLDFDAIKIGASYKLHGADRGIEPLK